MSRPRPHAGLKEDRVGLLRTTQVGSALSADGMRPATHPYDGGTTDQVQGRNGAGPQGRAIPNDAKSRTAQDRTARNPKRRQIPYGARSQTARNPERRDERERRGPAGGHGHAKARPPRVVRASRALWDSAPSGIARSSGFRALWDYAGSGRAPFGISRRSGLRALEALRRLEFRAVSELHPPITPGSCVFVP
jgi:hypothetical protein